MAAKLTSAQQQGETVRLTRHAVTVAQQQEATVRLTRLSVQVAIAPVLVGPWNVIPI